MSKRSRKRGSTAVAIAFHAHLKNYFPGMYDESSTHGKGMQGWILLVKKGVTADKVAEAGKRLEKWLRYQAKLTNADIEQVEIKGLPRRNIYQDDELVGFTYGTLAKLPRHMKKAKTFVLECKDLMSPRFDVPEEEEIDETPASSMPIPESYTENIEKYRQDAGDLLAQHEFHRPSGREKLTEEDLAGELLVLHYCTDTLPENGAMPHDRIHKLWIDLHKAQVITRRWSNKRHAAMVRSLADLGYIDVQDATYYFYPTDKITGKRKKGQAAKWCLSESFYERQEEYQEERGDSSSSLREQPDEIPDKGVRLRLVLPPGRLMSTPFDHLLVDLNPYLHPWDGPTEGEPIEMMFAG